MSRNLAAGTPASSERFGRRPVAISTGRTFMVTAASLLLVVATSAVTRAQVAGTAPPVRAAGIDGRVGETLTAPNSATTAAVPSDGPPAPPPLTPPTTVGTSATSPVRARPRFSAGVGMGASFDRTGLVGGRTEPVPAFQVQLGFGDGPLGVDVGLFATQGSGRYRERAPGGGNPDMGADRLGLDAQLAVRPFADRRGDSLLWVDRTLRTAAINVGIGAENVSVGVPSVLRLGVVCGAHIDLPLSPPDAAGTLAFRMTGRKMFAGRRETGAVSIDDTLLELFGGLAVVF